MHVSFGSFTVPKQVLACHKPRQHERRTLWKPTRLISSNNNHRLVQGVQLFHADKGGAWEKTEPIHSSQLRSISKEEQPKKNPLSDPSQFQTEILKLSDSEIFVFDQWPEPEIFQVTKPELPK